MCHAGRLPLSADRDTLQRKVYGWPKDLFWRTAVSRTYMSQNISKKEIFSESRGIASKVLGT